MAEATMTEATKAPAPPHRPSILPGHKDPGAVIAKLPQVREWVARFGVQVEATGRRSLMLPEHHTPLHAIESGVTLYRECGFGPLISDALLKDLRLAREYNSASPSVTHVTLNTRPVGGDDISLPEARKSFAAQQRIIAASPEVVAGFVAFHVASLVPTLEHAVSLQKIYDRGGKTFMMTAPITPFTAGFAPAGVFRSNDETFAFNSLTGLSLHDLTPKYLGKGLFVIERER